MSAKATIDTTRNVLVIEVPLQEPKLSKEGKTFLIGSTGGWTGTNTKLANGSEVRINVMAGFKNPNPPAKSAVTA